MSKTKRIVVISVLCSLSVVLDIIKEFIPFVNLPSGGSINISLIPIMVCSFSLGLKEGFLCSIISFIVSSLLGLNNMFLSIPQYVLDYIVPTICVGGCSFFYINKNIKEMELGIALSMMLRTLSIVLSGSMFWLESTVIAGSKEAFIGSIIYNVPYAIATLIVLAITVPFIVKLVDRYLV